MNTPIRFDLNINAQKLIAALKDGLSRSSRVPVQRIEHAQSGGELMDIYEAPLRQSCLSVWVLGVEYKITEIALRRAIQLLADRYPSELGCLLAGDFSDGSADTFVQCALFGEVRYA